MYSPSSAPVATSQTVHGGSISSSRGASPASRPTPDALSIAPGPCGMLSVCAISTRTQRRFAVADADDVARASVRRVEALHAHPQPGLLEPPLHPPVRLSLQPPGLRAGVPSRAIESATLYGLVPRRRGERDGGECGGQHSSAIRARDEVEVLMPVRHG